MTREEIQARIKSIQATISRVEELNLYADRAANEDRETLVYLRQELARFKRMLSPARRIVERIEIPQEETLAYSLQKIREHFGKQA